MTKVSSAWELLNDRLDLESKIAAKQYCRVEASDFHEINVQPRLNTKFDTRKDLPDLFKINNWGILPDSRNSYVVGKFDMFEDIELPSDIEKANAREIQPHTKLISLTSQDIYSEAAALNLLFSSGGLKSLVGEDPLPTVSGRMGSGDFEFLINSTEPSAASLKLRTSKSTMEIDAGYETSSSLLLFEAKNNFTDSINIRQLYFPFRKWTDQISKQVRPFLLLKQGDVYFVTEFVFTDPKNYSSIKKVNDHIFRIGAFRFSHKQIIDLVASGPMIRCQERVPFPQADNISSYQKLIDLLSNGPLSKTEIADSLNFDERQSDYYSNALRFLCLAEKSGTNEVRLSKLGDRYLQSRELARNEILISQMSQLESIKFLIKKEPGEIDIRTNEEFNKVVLKDFSDLFNQSPEASTVFRRSQTVAAWVSWIRSIGG